MSFIDVHAHLDVFSDEELKKILKNAQDNNVTIIVSAGVDHASNMKVLEISKKYPAIKACLGIYPPDALSNEKGKKVEVDIDKEIEFIEKNKSKIVAIGECGLDYSGEANKNLQKNIFMKQVELAKKIGKPILVHSRKAEADVIDILEASKIKKVVLHCFCGKKNLIKRSAKLGYYFSIPTNIVRAQNFQEIVKEVSINQLLTETDTPYLSPFKDKQNEPAFVIESAKKIAEIKGFELKEVENNILMNYKILFE